MIVHSLSLFKQKNYYDIKRKALELEIGDKVFLRVAPMKGVMRFGKKVS